MMNGSQRWLGIQKLTRRLGKYLPAVVGAIAVSLWASTSHMSSHALVHPPSEQTSAPASEQILHREAIETVGVPSQEFLVAQESSLQLSASSPANESTDVSISSLLQLTFSQELPTDFETLAIELSPEASLAFNSSGNTIVLQPTEGLGFSTTYTLTIPTQESLPLASDAVVTFTTEPEFTYDIDVLPLLDASCVGCHQPPGRARASALNTFEGVMAYVEPGDEGSELIDSRWTQRHAVIARGNRFIQNPVTGTRTQVGSGSAEISYVNRNGTDIARLGQWTAEEVDLVTTWIVQDMAVETSESRTLRAEAEGG